MPQFDYVQPILSLGQVATTVASDSDSFVNELLAQQNTVPIGGTTDGVYTVQIEGEEGVFQFSFTASTSTADQIADGLAAAVLADPDLANIVDASSTSGTPLLLNFIHTGKVYIVTFPSNPSGNMTLTVVQAAGGTDVPLASAVVRGSNDESAVLPDSGSVDADFVGIVGKNTDVQVNTIAGAEVGGEALISRFVPSNVMTVYFTGDIAVRNTTAVVKGDQVFARVSSPTTNAPLGSLSNAAGNSVLLTGTRWERTQATIGGLSIVRLNRPTSA